MLETVVITVQNSAHVAIFMFAFLTIICWNAELSFFMKISSTGVIFLILLIAYIMLKGFEAFTNTEFQTGTAILSIETDW